MILPDVEEVAAKVHAGWVRKKQQQGITSRLSETGEELMVDYPHLSEPAKDTNRWLVQTVYEALREEE